MIVVIRDLEDDTTTVYELDEQYREDLHHYDEGIQMGYEKDDDGTLLRNAISNMLTFLCKFGKQIDNTIYIQYDSEFGMG